MKSTTVDQAVDEESSATIEEIVSRARSLYSLPAVAAEVIQLTNNPKVDTRALRDCIANDPALTVKILRVVNSSLFGLSREVRDLNQALALLGTKPLKLLVLGFSLPEKLFSDVTSDVLDWYWSSTLSRAIAAREISEQLYGRPGDDAFLAGLLQDIGVLVLLNQLKEPYARFLSRVIQERCDLHQVEVDSLGFNHTALSAALLEQWNMPESLVDAIAEPQVVERLSRLKTPEAQLAQILHLAGLLSQLVGQNRLSALPDLMQVGEAYCELDKEGLTEMVELLQPKVQQLAEVLSLKLPDGVNYTDVLSEAHDQMAAITENLAEPLSRCPAAPEQQVCDDMLADVAHLRQAVDGFLQSEMPSADNPATEQSRPASAAKISSDGTQNPQSPVVSLMSKSFVNNLTMAVGQCRFHRQPISLIVLEVSSENKLDREQTQSVAVILDTACQHLDFVEKRVDAPSAARRVIVLPNCERWEAVAAAGVAHRHIHQAVQQLGDCGVPLGCVVSAGVAATQLPPKNFPPMDLLKTAERCLAAASSGSGGVVKSLEIS